MNSMILLAVLFATVFLGLGILLFVSAASEYDATKRGKKNFCRPQAITLK